MFQNYRAVSNILFLNIYFFIAITVVNSLTNSWVIYLPLWSMDSSNFWFGQFITYQISHLNFFHLFSNMLIFLALSPHIESRFGSNIFYLIYFLCGVFSGLFHNLMVGGTHPLIGASGSIWGICVIWGFLKPNYEIRLPLIPIDFRAKYLIVFFLCLELILSIYSVDNEVSHWGHIGGSLSGLLIYSLIYVWENSKKSGMSWVRQLSFFLTSLLK